MKITHLIKARLVAAAALCAGLGVATQASALERHYFVDLNSGTVRELENLEDRYLNLQPSIMLARWWGTSRRAAAVTQRFYNRAKWPRDV